MNRIETSHLGRNAVGNDSEPQRESPRHEGYESRSDRCAGGCRGILATRVSIPHLDDVVVQALALIAFLHTRRRAEPASDIRRATNTQSHDPADKDDP